MQLRWQPLLSGRAADPFDRVVDDIVAALDREGTDPIDFGRPLLHAYLAKARSSTADRDRAVSLADRAIEMMESETLSPALYGGFAGVGWLAAHLESLFRQVDQQALEKPDSKYDFDEVTDALLLTCKQQHHRPLYDLIGGLVGFGVYFLEQLPSESAVEGLGQVVDALEGTAERLDGQVTWWTAPYLLHETQRAIAPRGYYNLGVAHGVPGIVGFLAEIHRAGLLSSKINELLTGSIRWVLSRQLPGGSFPSYVEAGIESTPSRLAWCYGELGASLTLLLAARTIGDSSLERTAVEIALMSSQRRGKAAAVNDAGLCHGAAGNAHLYNRLLQATGRAEFKDAAMFWFARALEMRRDGMGIGGYQTFKPMGRDGMRKADNPWLDDTSFLGGASGIALALLAATTPVEPRWDRLLLCDVPPRPSTAGYSR